MRATGIVRRIDALGRLVLPIELRESLDLSRNDAVEIFTSGDMIVLKKYCPADIFTGEMDDLIDYNGKKVSKKTIKELARIAGFNLTEINRDEDDDMFKLENPLKK